MLHAQLLAETGGAHGIRDEGLLDSAYLLLAGGRSGLATSVNHPTCIVPADPLGRFG